MEGNVRAVRNFWVEVEIDGQKTIIKGGPKAKDGGMKITLYQRSSGGIVKPYTITCTADDEGTLVSRVENTMYKPAEYLTKEVSAR